MDNRHFISIVATAAIAFSSSATRAAVPDSKTLLRDLGLSDDEITQVQSGRFATLDIKPASEREIVTATAFQVSVTPVELIKDLKNGLFLSVDPNTIATGVIKQPASANDFAKLALGPDGEKQRQVYASAKPSGDLNLSTDEIAAFNKLGTNVPVAAVEEQVRAALAARAEAYRARGLSGIAPYARSSGQRSPAEELRNASQASMKLKAYVPALYDLLLSYPQSKPAGTEEMIRWTQIQAQGVPTITLTHALVVPDGDAWIVVQRQFYVSTGYNSEQAIAALLPVQNGTVVVYSNRTSTDQVAGFGGSAKRSIGSKILASQLQDLFAKIQTKFK